MEKTKYFLRALYSILAIFFFSQTIAQSSIPEKAEEISVTPSGFLNAKNKVIVNGQGKTFVLRGMGLGGWMLQEGYMFRLSNIGQQYRIKEKIAELVGKQKADEFYKDWLSYHTTKADIDSLAAWGFNSVRLPMHYQLYTLAVEDEPIPGKNTWINTGFEMTDSLLTWCKANNMYLILDLHATPGGQGNDLNISDRNPAKPSLWESEDCQQKTIALWRKLAERYAHESFIGGYDIINEPNWGFENPKDDIRGIKEKSNKPLRDLMIRITAAIREVDSTHMIIIEGNGFGNNYNGIFPLWDKNMVVSFHKYGNFNTQSSIQNFLDLQDKYNIPLWLGESGENSNTWFTEAIQLVESRNIGWCWWQLKKMGINNPLEIKINSSYQKLLNYWSDKGQKPTEMEADNALQDWLESIKLKNNIYHPDVTDAMFRQVSSFKTIPFRNHVIRNAAIIKAVDYDLGRAGYAYHDNDTARYQYASPQAPSAGNRGRAYRNDGVDIQSRKDINGAVEYDVFNIEDGEWLQYTINVADAGIYTIAFTISSANSSGLISIQNNSKTMNEKLPIKNTDSLDNWQTVEIGNIILKKGRNQLRIIAEKGGFNFNEMRFMKSSREKKPGR